MINARLDENFTISEMSTDNTPLTEEEEDVKERAVDLEEVAGCVADCVGDTVELVVERKSFFQCFKRWVVKIIKCIFSRPSSIPRPELPSETPPS
jgi:uncharacterized lipoprotein